MAQRALPGFDQSGGIGYMVLQHYFASPGAPVETRFAHAFAALTLRANRPKRALHST